MPLLDAFVLPHPPLIIPEIGKGQETTINKTIAAYELAAKRIGELKPDTILVITPHSILYSDYLHISAGKSAKGSFSDFGASKVSMEVPYDTAFAEELTSAAEKKNIPAGTLGEKMKNLDHGFMVPLYFVNKYYTNYKTVRLSISGLSPLTHYRYGKCISEIAENSEKRYLIIASGDLSHRLKEDGPYGYSQAGETFDKEIIEAFHEGNFLKFLQFSESFCDEAAECGLRSFIVMAGALDGRSVEPEVLSYEGPFGVGYGVAAFKITEKDENRHFDRLQEELAEKELVQIREKEDPYVKLARESLEYYLTEQKTLKRPEGLISELLQEKAGVFVSLKKEGRLRGCIGTILPTTSCLADEIIQNAVSAGTMDNRFEPVQIEELPWLVYDVEVLGKSEPIDSIHDLDVKKYGVIVSYKGRRGLLLPDLEGVDTPEQQVTIALKKANIRPEEPFVMERFKVVRHL